VVVASGSSAASRAQTLPAGRSRGSSTSCRASCPSRSRVAPASGPPAGTARWLIGSRKRAVLASPAGKGVLISAAGAVPWASSAVAALHPATRSSTSMPGERRASRRATRAASPPTNGQYASRMAGPLGTASRAASAENAATWSSSASASGSSTLPASDSCTSRLVRSNSRRPSARSSRATAWLTAGCDMPSPAAAREKLSRWATAVKQPMSRSGGPGSTGQYCRRRWRAARRTGP
jgi:hypothetical protein